MDTTDLTCIVSMQRVHKLDPRAHSLLYKIDYHINKSGRSLRHAFSPNCNQVLNMETHAGTTFTDLVPDDFHPYVISASDSTSLYQCTFHNNHIHSHAGALVVASLHGKVRVEECTYDGNTVSQEFFDSEENNPAIFYSDQSLVVGFPMDNDIMTSPLEYAGEDFMGSWDGRVGAIREVWCIPCACLLIGWSRSIMFCISS